MSSSRRIYLLAGTAILLTALLLSLQYSYGIGTTTYSLAQYIWRTWSESEDMGHGMIVLPATLFLIWHDRKRLLSIRPVAGWGGLPVLTAGLLLYWMGHQADVTFIGLVSTVIVLAGSVWWLLGWESLQGALVPDRLPPLCHPVSGTGYDDRPAAAVSDVQDQRPAAQHDRDPRGARGDRDSLGPRCARSILQPVRNSPSMWPIPAAGSGRCSP